MDESFYGGQVAMSEALCISSFYVLIEWRIDVFKDMFHLDPLYTQVTYQATLFLYVTCKLMSCQLQ